MSNNGTETISSDQTFLSIELQANTLSPYAKFMHLAVALRQAAQELTSNELQSDEIQSVIKTLAGPLTSKHLGDLIRNTSISEIQDMPEIQNVKRIMYHFDPYMRSIEILHAKFLYLGTLISNDVEDVTAARTMSNAELEAYKLIFPKNNRKILNSQLVHYSEEADRLLALIKRRLSQHVERLKEVPNNATISLVFLNDQPILCFNPQPDTNKVSLRKELFELANLAKNLSAGLRPLEQDINIKIDDSIIVLLDAINTLFQDHGLPPYLAALRKSLESAYRILDRFIPPTTNIANTIFTLKNKILEILENFRQDKYLNDWALSYFDSISLEKENTTFLEILELAHNQIKNNLNAPKNPS